MSDQMAELARLLEQANQHGKQQSAAEIERLRAENETLRLELDMQQATILVPSQKDDQRRIERLDAALKEALDEAATVRAENEKLRHELITSSDAAKYYDYGYSCARDMQKDEITRLRAEHKMAFEAVGDVVKANDELRSQIESAEQAYVRLDASMNRLKAAFRVNMLRAFPNMSHEEIDVEIEDAIWESGK